jgi:hypothetical protein
MKLSNWFITLEWKPQDLWIGIYFTKKFPDKTEKYEYRFHLWICIIPCIPIHITCWVQNKKETP